MADDQPMWANNRAVAPTLASAIIAVDLGDNFTVKEHHISMIKDCQFDGRARVDPHRHIDEFIKICEIKGEMKEMRDGCNKCEGPHPSSECDDKPIEDEADEAERKEELSLSTPSNYDQPPLKAINTLLVDVLAGMPNYGKFLKDLVSNKSKMEQISAASLNEECSLIIQNKLLPKLGDPGSFLIPCTFSNLVECLALADLGASINLMPYSLYTSLSVNTLKPTKMSLDLFM
nr:reverse transcriptase domain-containing protein [Tanacetum cinerariifolium]